MKISCLLTLIILCAFVSVYAYSGENMDQKVMQPAPTYEKAKSQETNNPPVVTSTDEAKSIDIVNTNDTLLEKKSIKTETMCLNGDCRNRWPVLKCADYGERPAGETGDEYCAKINKTCLAVSIGGGQSFFDQCSVPVNSVHKCRCCWVQ
jgi:hypothetical protein